MTPYTLLISTVGPREEAQKIARELVERKLAACVNIVGPIESIYSWEGNIDTAQEFMLLIKTEGTRFDEISSALKELHSYTVPELIQVPIENGLPAYLDWISSSIR